ncbi:MAG: diacylglycerol kinase family lipid kinase [Candidatus Marinimicrobia bacterium]|jgi:YegS/Rv2252/BmrU family lipid kinase|nr:diacylglycerol kinase family lipid kinase [Candidatus Neomarinimicrobiota bacterium]MDD5063119.1 diacylglycerol kinase family lipid kinase [Candidatus Neomarinimicrobiota bacterium]
MKILLIYNPFAGHGHAQKILPDVESIFEDNNVNFDLMTTDYHEHGITLVKEADFEKYDAVVAAGGDGTLFEVINGYFQNQSTRRIPIGVLPVGTGNAFARDLDLDSNHWKEAINIISLNKPRQVDVGKFLTHGQTYYFLNILGLGFVSDVTATAHKIKAIGNLAYTIGVFHQTLFLHTFGARLEIDGQILEHDCIFIEISNTRYTANFLMAPTAEIDDGRLDVTILKGLSRRKLLKCFPKIFTGEHVHMEEVETYQARKVKIITDTPKILTPDGEVLGITPIDVECLYRQVEVLWK